MDDLCTDRNDYEGAYAIYEFEPLHVDFHEVSPSTRNQICMHQHHRMWEGRFTDASVCGAYCVEKMDAGMFFSYRNDGETGGECACVYQGDTCEERADEGGFAIYELK